MPGARPRVVIVGAGFGGLAVARGLRDEAVDVVVVDANNFHTFQPLLYQVATAGLSGDDIAYAVRGIFRRLGNVTVRMARVTAVDPDRRLVRLDSGDALPYEFLVVAAGAVTASFGVPGALEHALALKTLDDALAVRASVLASFERTAADPRGAPPGALDVVVCGGGPTGVELAGGLMELYTKVLAKDFPGLDVGASRIVLVEAADRLLSGFHPSSSERALRTLTRRGVEVVTGVGVERVGPGCVVLADGRELAAQTVVWAAGVQASPLAAALGVETTRGGRVVVADDLSVPGRPEMFAIGDIAATPAADGRLQPQVAQVAIQGGRHVARQIGRRLRGLPTVPFRYVDKGSMATIGRHDAVAELPGGVRLRGPIGWLAWLALHLVYLMGFRNRATVLVNWAWNYLTFDRGARLLREGDRRPATPPR